MRHIQPNAKMNFVGTHWSVRMPQQSYCGCSTRRSFDGLSTYGFCMCFADGYLTLASYLVLSETASTKTGSWVQ